MLERLIVEAEAGGFRQMIAVIGDSANAASIELHRAAGFRMVGTFDNVGFKFGRWLDSVLMQRPLGTGARPQRPDSLRRTGYRANRDTGDRSQPATTRSDLSIAPSTRSSSWPRRTMRPVAEITL